MNLAQIQKQLHAGEITVEGLLRGYLKAIESSKDLNIYVEVFAEEALEKARALDSKIKKTSDQLGKLAGAIISIKDVLCYKGHTASAGSKMLSSFVSPYTGTTVQRLIDEDAIIIGRVNCDEFAMGSTNEHSHYGPTKNGLGQDRVPGGSSGASAVAVQQDTCLVSLGSDTGGSVRQPAALCGVIGMKPSYGRVSRYGLIAYGSSFDQIGVLGRDVDDIAQILHVISGEDPLDATSLRAPKPNAAPVRKEHYKIAYLQAALDRPGVNNHIKSDFKDYISQLESQGQTVEPVSFDLMDYVVPTYYILTTAEASSNLSRFDGIRYGHRSDDAPDLQSLYINSRTEGFGLEVKRRIMMGTFVLGNEYFESYFTKAQQVRTLIIRRLKEIFAQYDLLILPTVTETAWQIGEVADDPIAMYMADIFTVLANLGGNPAISIPRTHVDLELPFGIQVMADRGEDEMLLGFVRG